MDLKTLLWKGAHGLYQMAKGVHGINRKKKVKNSYPGGKSPGLQNTFYKPFIIHINIIQLLYNWMY